MEIAPTSVKVPQGPATAPSSPTTISSDFDTFLRLLTAQIGNQDPLDPMKAEEFAVQLATFSSVEQQVRTNQLLESLGGKLGANGLTDMAAWVGRSARAAMPAFFDGRPVEVSIPEPVAGNGHELVAFGPSGSEVWRQAIDPAAGPVMWNGVDDANIPVPPGLYSFRLESFEDGRSVASEPAQTYGHVREVRSDSRGLVLVFPGGVELPPDEVTALREEEAVA